MLPDFFTRGAVTLSLSSLLLLSQVRRRRQANTDAVDPSTSTISPLEAAKQLTIFPVHARKDANEEQWVASPYGSYVSGWQHSLARVASKTSVMVSLDLDGTLVGTDEGTREFSLSWCRTHHEREGSTLIYNSGRGLSAFVRLLEECAQRGLAVVRPDYYIAAEGSEVFEFVEGEVEPKSHPVWDAHLQKEWDIDEVRAIVRSIASCPHFASCLRRFPEESTRDENYRESLVLEGEDNAIALSAALMEAFGRAGVRSKPQVFHCGGVYYDGVLTKLLWVSVVPEASGKGKALDFVRRHLGVPSSRVFSAGDGGNDIAQMSDEGVVECSCMVSNAHPELVAFVHSHNTTRNRKIHVSPRPHAHGIVDGLQHFGFFE